MTVLYRDHASLYFDPRDGRVIGSPDVRLCGVEVFGRSGFVLVSDVAGAVTTRVGLAPKPVRFIKPFAVLAGGFLHFRWWRRTGVYGGAR